MQAKDSRFSRFPGVQVSKAAIFKDRNGYCRPREDPVAQDLIVLTSTGSVLSRETQSETHMTSGHCKWFVCNIWVFPKIMVPPNHPF